MTMKMKVLVTSAILLVVGIAMVAFVDTKGPEPSFACAAEGTASSGFSDSSQGDCPVSIESFNEWSEWVGKPQIGKIAGLGVAAAGLVVGVVGLVMRSRPRERG